MIGIVGLLKTARAGRRSHSSSAGRAVMLLGGLGDVRRRTFRRHAVRQSTSSKQLWGLPPALDMDYEKRVQDAIREIVGDGLAESAHDLSDGGLAVALAECCFANEIGAQVELDSDLRPEFLLFHEGSVAHSDFYGRTRTGAGNRASKWRGSVATSVLRLRSELTIRNRDTALIDCTSVVARALVERARRSARSRTLKSMFDKFHEECGVFAIYGHPEAAKLAYLGLYALQHRGQESAGICTSDGARDLLPQGHGPRGGIFTRTCWRSLPGELAIGHTRYSTAGDTVLLNAQPFSVACNKGKIAVAHNGNITNAAELRARTGSATARSSRRRATPK